MADVYGVVAGDISAELAGLYPAGFSATTVPTLAQVTAWISVADQIANLHLIDMTGGVPALTDAAAGIVKTFIREWVKTQVVRVAYVGNDPVQVAAAAKPYSDMAALLLTEIDAMGAQAVGIGGAAPRTQVSYTVPDRGLMVTDDELDWGPASPGGSDSSAFRTRKY